MTLLFVLLALVIGALLPVQTGINSRLRKELGDPVLASLVSFVVGTICLSVSSVVMRVQAPTLASLSTAPAWAWLGGACGAIFIFAAIVLAPRLGVGTMIGLVVTGQMLMAIMIDHFGWLGLQPHPVNLWRAIGATLLLIGVMLIQKF